jgi:hypothetical protein
VRHKTNETSTSDIECNMRCGFCGCSYSHACGFIIHVKKCISRKSQKEKGLPLNQKQTLILKKELSKHTIFELDCQLRKRVCQIDESELVTEEQDLSSNGDDEGSGGERELNQVSCVQSHRPNKHWRMSFSTEDDNGSDLNEASISGAFALCAYS